MQALRIAWRMIGGRETSMPNRMSKGVIDRSGIRLDGTAKIPGQIVYDPYRAFIFPNNLRVLRKQNGFPTLLALSAKISEMPYIRLSKIERGEVVAKATELTRIAGELHVDPLELLVDVRSDDFDMAEWAGDLIDPEALDRHEEEFAVLLASALRRRRSTDPGLTIAALNDDYGLPSVMLSRIENAQKTVERWNDQTIRSICRLFDVDGVPALREVVTASYNSGELADYVSVIDNPEHRIAKTIAKVTELWTTLSNASGARPVFSVVPKVSVVDVAPEPESMVTVTPPVPVGQDITVSPRLVPVFGGVLPDGLVARIPTDDMVEAPRGAGPRTWGLRVFRPTLGIGMPARAIVLVDPDRFPASGGLAVIEEDQGFRLLMVTTDRHGGMVGYSENPPREVAVDDIHPSKVAAVISAIFP